MPEQFGTRTAYAEHSGTSKPYVTKLGHTGKLVEVVRDGKTVVDFAATDAARAESSQLGRAGGDNARRVQGKVHRTPRPLPVPPGDEPEAVPSGGGGGEVGAAARVGTIFRQAQAQERAYLAKMTELKYKRAAGELVDRELVHRGAFEAARELRDAFMACARRVASEVAALSSAQECEAVIEREHRLVLQTLATTMRATLGATA